MKWSSYQTLNIISLITMGIAVGLALILPGVSWRDAYQKKLEDGSVSSEVEGLVETASYRDYVKLFFMRLKSDLISIYSNLHILKWSIWSALSSCIFYQVRFTDNISDRWLQ